MQMKHLWNHKTFLLTSHFRKCPDLVSHLGVWCFNSLLSISLLWQGGGPHWHAGENAFLSVVIPHTAMHLTPDQPRQHLILLIRGKKEKETDVVLCILNYIICLWILLQSVCCASIRLILCSILHTHTHTKTFFFIRAHTIRVNIIEVTEPWPCTPFRQHIEQWHWPSPLRPSFITNMISILLQQDGSDMADRTHVFIVHTWHWIFSVPHKEVLGTEFSYCNCRIKSGWNKIEQSDKGILKQNVAMSCCQIDRYHMIDHSPKISNIIGTLSLNWLQCFMPSMTAVRIRRDFLGGAFSCNWWKCDKNPSEILINHT